VERHAGGRSFVASFRQGAEVPVRLVAVGSTAVVAVRVAATHLPRDPVTIFIAAVTTNHFSYNSLATFVGRRVALDGAVPFGRKLQDLQRSHDVERGASDARCKSYS
jgi:hypothetical protein